MTVSGACVVKLTCAAGPVPLLFVAVTVNVCAPGSTSGNVYEQLAPEHADVSTVRLSVPSRVTVYRLTVPPGAVHVSRTFCVSPTCSTCRFVGAAGFGTASTEMLFSTAVPVPWPLVAATLNVCGPAGTDRNV